jgi:ABC-type glycerol-3-phosphate transport system permease component
MADLTGTSRLLAQAAPTDEHVARARPLRKGGSFRAITYIVLSLAAIIYIAPFVWMASKSLMNAFEANSASIIPSVLHFENYATALVDSNFGQFFWNSVRIAFLSITGQTLIALLAGYAFARMEFPGRDLIFGIFLLTIFIPETVLLVPNLVTVTRLNEAFQTGALRVFHLKWLNNWPALVIPYLSSTFSIFLLRQFFRQIPDELWDAARIDGAGHLRFLFQVVVPISRAAVLTTMLFSFVGTWSALQWPILVTDDNSWRPISVALQQFRSMEAGNNTNLLMAAAMIALVPVLIVYFFTQRHFTRGIATSGLKG